MFRQCPSSVGLTLTIALAAVTRLPAQAPALDELLERAATNLRMSTPALVNIVAQEQYTQQALVSSPGRAMRGSKQLRSDVLLVRYPGSEADWMLFRDVFEVDGTPLQHDPERLVALFVRPPADAADQIAAIVEESRKYHFGGPIPAVANPFVGVALLQPHYRSRLRFSGGGEDRAVGRGVRAVRFQERDGRDEKREPLFVEGRAEGTLWIEQLTGRIVQAEVWPYGRDVVRPTTTTTFAFDSRLGVMVPSEMRTTWYARGPTANSRGTVTGIATYGSFRRFQVDASATIVLPESKP